MEQVLTLLVMLVGVTHAFSPAAETKCDAIHNASLCSATLGGSVYIQVMVNASGLLLICKKQLPTGYVQVFTLKKETVTIQEALKNRTEFFIHNGTLKITNVEKNDSGQYNIVVYNPNGILMKNISFKLDVQENVFPISIWIIVFSAVAALVMVVMISSCICWGVRRCKKSASGK